MVLCMVIVLVVLNVLVGLNSQSVIDNYGHLGGFLMGFILSFVLIVPIESNEYNSVYKKIATAVIPLYFIAGLVVFFVCRHPVQI